MLGSEMLLHGTSEKHYSTFKNLVCCISRQRIQ